MVGRRGINWNSDDKTYYELQRKESCVEPYIPRSEGARHIEDIHNN